MSMVSELVNKLRIYVEAYKNPPYGREIAGTTELMERAADTIETLSAKLAAANMNRSERYYSGGWIPVEKRLPNEKEFIKEYRRNHHAAEFIVMIEGATLPTTLYYLKDTKSWVDENQNYYRVVAWQPLPEPYRPSDEYPKDSQGI